MNRQLADEANELEGDRTESLSDESVINSPRKRRDVEVLYTNGDRVLVRGTLNPGNQVIVDGTHRFVSGQLVQPLKAEISRMMATPI